MGENEFAQLPVALYGIVLWVSALAYYILTRALVSLHGTDSILATALGRKIKKVASLVIYTAAIALAFVNSGILFALHVFVAIMWLTLDTRIEKTLEQ
jgi:uncharacterized membrane protein